jgi:hypothetical protein
MHINGFIRLTDDMLYSKLGEPIRYVERLLTDADIL